MGEHKNLILAIILSIAIIVIFQLLFPEQYMVSTQSGTDKIETSDGQENTTSIVQVQENKLDKVKTKEEIISENNRILIESESVKGSINLKGAIIDDLILTKYKESLDENSNNINILSPMGTRSPYYV